MGLVSLTDTINTTSAQCRLVFNLFASLAEFERELIRERTHAGTRPGRGTGWAVAGGALFPRFAGRWFFFCLATQDYSQKRL